MTGAGVAADGSLCRDHVVRCRKESNSLIFKEARRC
jgi:hypothetical protein